MRSIIEALMGLSGRGGTEGARGYPGGANPPDMLARMAQEHLERAAPPIRAYHGTREGPGEGETFKIPERDFEQGVFFTPDPKTASDYAWGAEPYPPAYMTGGKVYPVNIHASNSAIFDMMKLPEPQRYYDSERVDTAMKSARDAGKDFLIIKNMEDVGGAHDQIIALRPSGKVKSAITGQALYGALGALMGMGRKESANATETRR